MRSDVNGCHQRFQHFNIFDSQTILVDERTAFDQLLLADDQLLVEQEQGHFSGPSVGRYFKKFALMNQAAIECGNITSLNNKKIKFEYY